MNKKDTAVLPELRFREFRTAGRWSTTRLCLLAERVTLRNQDGSIRRVLTNSAVDGVVDQFDYFDRKIVGQNHLKNYYVIDQGDYVYNPRMSVSAPVGPISKNKLGKGIISPLYTVFRFKNTNNDFYEQYFKTSLWHDYIRRKSNTGARHDRISITTDDFMNMPLPISADLNEQQKIADCMASIDELTDVQTKKLAALRQHKNGLMQKLFPTKEGTVPQLRFAEFSANSIEFLHGNELFESIHDKEHNCDLPLLAITQEHGAVPRGQIDYKVFVTDKSVEGYKVVEIGDFIISLRSFQGGIEYSLYRGLCSPAYVVLRKKIDLVNEYYKYYFKTQKFIQSLNKNLEGIRDGKMVSYGQFSELLLPKPSKAEQEKIAQILLSLDALIVEERKKLDALWIHKKGLMQKLYPSIAEVCE